MEPITLTATTIATLAFQKFLESSAAELGKKFSSEAINKMDELRQKIWNKLRGNSNAEEALENVEQGLKEKLTNVAKYLETEMENDTEFASEIQTIARKINAGKIQDNSNMNMNVNDEATGIMTKAESGSKVTVAKEIKNYYNSSPND